MDKVCTKCGQSKPLDAYYVEKGKPRASCKDCHKKKVYERSPERIREINAASRARHREKNRERERERRARDGDALNARQRQARAADPERFRAAEKTRRDANLERARATQRASHARHKDRKNAERRAIRAHDPESIRKAERAYLTKNRERVNARARAYYKANPEKWENARRAREARKAGVEHQPYTRREIYHRDGGHCRACRKTLPYAPNGFQIDHIVPLSLGGPDIPANVQLMCPTCNRQKWARLEGQIHLPV